MDARDPRRIVYERQQWLRPDWRRFMPPGFELAEQREAARERAMLLLREVRELMWAEARETEALRLRAKMAGLKLERALLRYARKYSPDQPRVPAGNPDGGQWTSDGSAPSPTVGPLVTPVADDNRPVYDKADAALLAPKGVNSTSSEQKLRFSLDEDSRYLGGVTVTNEDRTAVGRFLQSVNGTPVAVRFTAEIQTANGVSTSSFEIRQNLSPGSSITIPWKDLGPMEGPGRVEVTATNVGSLYTGVVVGAIRIPNTGDR